MAAATERGAQRSAGVGRVRQGCGVEERGARLPNDEVAVRVLIRDVVLGLGPARGGEEPELVPEQRTAEPRIEIVNVLEGTRLRGQPAAEQAIGRRALAARVARAARVVRPLHPAVRTGDEQETL